MSDSRKRILGSFLVGFVMLGGAWLLSQWQVPGSPTEGSLAVVPGASRTLIGVSDKNEDGIPDWQEALQRTEPIALETASGTYELPDTLTDKFAVQFFQDMVRSENIGAFGSDPNELAAFATEQFNEQAVDELYEIDDVVLSTDNSPAAIKNYANSMALVVLRQTIPADYPSEIEILQQAYGTTNPETLKKLDVLIEGYEAMIAKSLAITVPDQYAKEHLDIINVYQAVLTDIKAMSMAFTDPLFTIIRLKRYEEDAATLAIVSLNLYKKMLESGIVLNENDPASQLLPQLN